MISRRDVLVGGLMAGASAVFLHDGAHAAAPQPRTKVNFVQAPALRPDGKREQMPKPATA